MNIIFIILYILCALIAGSCFAYWGANHQDDDHKYNPYHSPAGLGFSTLVFAAAWPLGLFFVILLQIERVIKYIYSSKPAEKFGNFLLRIFQNKDVDALGLTDAENEKKNKLASEKYR